MATLRSVAQRHILLHALLAGLTPLVPLPFVDDVLRARAMRRLVATLAAVHDLALDPSDVKRLADPPGATWIKDAARRIAMVPLRFVAGRALVLLTAKHVIDLASESWHRGFLIDLAFSERLCAPVGPYSADQVRRAVDAVCIDVPVAPVAHSIRLAVGQARRAFIDAMPSLMRILARLGGEPMPAPEPIGDDDSALSGLLERMLRATSELSSEHVRTLRGRLLQRLSDDVPAR